MSCVSRAMRARSSSTATRADSARSISARARRTAASRPRFHAISTLRASPTPT
jgi:hypothetical protein